MHQPFVEISDSGVNVAHSQPTRYASRKHDYKRRPVNVALHHNLTLEIHGEHFSTSTKLSVDDAMGLISMLSYAVREHLARRPVDLPKADV